LADVRRQLQRPLADRTGSLERQVAFIVQVRLEQPGVIGPAARDDRLDPTEIVAEAPGVIAVAAVPAVDEL